MWMAHATDMNARIPWRGARVARGLGRSPAGPRDGETRHAGSRPIPDGRLRSHPTPSGSLTAGAIALTGPCGRGCLTGARARATPGETTLVDGLASALHPPATVDRPATLQRSFGRQHAHRPASRGPSADTRPSLTLLLQHQPLACHYYSVDAIDLPTSQSRQLKPCRWPMTSAFQKSRCVTNSNRRFTGCSGGRAR